VQTTTIGDVARLAGITIRTLHHYDDIELLTPSERRANGYRGYSAADISRLQQILAYRELDLGLEEIRRLLDERSNPVAALSRARYRIAQQVNRLEHIAATLDAAIASEVKGTTMTPEDKLKAFGDFDPEAHSDAVEERWGGTDAFAESARRTNSYTPDDWQRLTSEADDIYQAMLRLMDAGIPPDSTDAAVIVDAHRAHITKWFYTCSLEIHAGLGAMYTADERFRTNINRAGNGLADYLSDAIAARYGDGGADS
jgi:DNA-binding transcriptional MerR regulator